MKTLVFVVLLLAMVTSAFAFPTYTVTPGEADGTYGPTGIPVVYYDETGSQLFDGQYGKLEWMNLQPIQSVDDYNNRYEQQNGYALPWVGWRTSTPIIVFDLEQSFSFSQIGVHACNETALGTHLPAYVMLSFSDNGIDYTEELYKDFAHGYPWQNHNSYWLNFDVNPTQARFVRIQLERNLWVLIDEISINGMDGGQFPVPEPSSLLALCVGAAGLLAFRRRQLS